MQALSDHREEVRTPMTTQTQTAFGRVLSELLEERGIAATPETMGQPVLGRMSSTDVPYAGPLATLIDEFELTMEETSRLSWAFTFDQDRTFTFGQ